ncbi:hypothetical protein [Pantoea ananatis]|uniref:hypothetical protein n=1 Tax=Pantoea ananas TaxID=553 RepID=UPI001B315078|nr:hypothetical protein [Pantoea ananatis]
MISKDIKNNELEYSFSESIRSGLNNATKVISNLNEIEKIFSKASNDISKVLEDDKVEIKLRDHSGASYLMALIGKVDIEKMSNSGIISIIREDKKFDFATWSQDKEGFPFTITYEGAKYKCTDSKSLIAFLNNLFSNGAFWFRAESKIYPDKIVSDLKKPRPRLRKL